MQNRLVSLPPLDALRGFVAAARRMSITAAADDLCLTQSAVSRQIQALEERLGTPLFTRSNRSIALTAAGEQLFQLASPWMDRLADLAESLRQDQRVRPVTVSASMGVASLWLLPRLGGFQSAHPHIDVRVATSNRVLDLERDGIDLAIRYSPASHATQGGQLLFDEVVAPVASPVVAARAFRKPEALLQHVLLDLDDKVGPWLHWEYWLQEQGLERRKPKGRLHFNHYDQLIHAALGGHGVAVGRLPLLLPMLKDGRLAARMDQCLQVDDYRYWLMEAPGAQRAEVAAFRDWLVQQAALTAQELAQAYGAMA
ncbi:LysR family transcriptional regulator [Massilia sp. Root351]|uniref:LysR substrate-binding domain-containing protein n=1 Tax=Massilia sp. Root351 TaxID=1736522 RepID=UPI00070D137B|nr:LysR substrate-binding domain-containing protein [Massilia sp. Root351]KQV90022.1 LysR family transcriptional regulator [Massilia sp. Root351]